MNRYLKTVVIAPITSSSKAYATRIEVKDNKAKGWIVIDQIGTIDKNRIIRTFDNLTEKQVADVKAVIKETYVD